MSKRGAMEGAATTSTNDGNELMLDRRGNHRVHTFYGASAERRIRLPFGARNIDVVSPEGGGPNRLVVEPRRVLDIASMTFADLQTANIIHDIVRPMDPTTVYAATGSGYRLYTLADGILVVTANATASMAPAKAVFLPTTTTHKIAYDCTVENDGKLREPATYLAVANRTPLHVSYDIEGLETGLVLRGVLRTDNPSQFVASLQLRYNLAGAPSPIVFNRVSVGAYIHKEEEAGGDQSRSAAFGARELEDAHSVVRYDGLVVLVPARGEHRLGSDALIDIVFYHVYDVLFSGGSSLPTLYGALTVRSDTSIPAAPISLYSEISGTELSGAAPDGTLEYGRARTVSFGSVSDIKVVCTAAEQHQLHYTLTTLTISVSVEKVINNPRAVYLWYQLPPDSELISGENLQVIDPTQRVALPDLQFLYRGGIGLFIPSHEGDNRQIVFRTLRRDETQNRMA